MAELPCYTLIQVPSDMEMPSEMAIKESLEKGDAKTKVETLKKLILMILNGEKCSQSLLMFVIRFCLPMQDHQMKKMLLIFWEIVPKTSGEGKLLHEMILVCDAYRKDLQHPNEFIRGSTLRFLCKLKEPELLDPLMPAIRACLEHRHSYVRRNAVLAVFTIYRNFDFLIPDAPEMMLAFLEAEQDASCKRNAFMMLLHVDQARALDYLSGCVDSVTSFGDILQLIIVELIYKVCHAQPGERARFIRCVYSLLSSSSAAVRYEAAGTLLTLSAAPTAIRAAASAYIDLIVKESDNNVKLIVLDRLIALRANPASEKVLQELVMDVLRVLSSPDLHVRKKTLNLALDLASSRNVEEMVMFLRKEVSKTTNAGEQEDTEKYRQLLVRTLHRATIKFPEGAANIIPVLMEFLSDNSELAAADVLAFVREAIQKLPHLREVILAQLMEVFPTISNLKTYRGAAWILGEYAGTAESVQGVMTLVRQSLGELPVVEDELRSAEETEDAGRIASADAEMKASVKQLVTADGTYATQSALASAPKAAKASAAAKPPLRRFLLDGNFFVGASLAGDLTKLVLRYKALLAEAKHPEAEKRSNAFAAEAMFILACMIHLGKSGLPKTPITEDDLDRLAMAVKLLGEGAPVGSHIFLKRCRGSLETMLEASLAEKEAEEGGSEAKAEVEADEPIGFTQLVGKLEVGGGAEAQNVFELSLSQALGTAPKTSRFDASGGKLGKVTQLAGFSDPVYAEAYVNVNQYDIVLDVLVVNQTGDTLEALTMELATLGDLKLVEKPQPITLAPHDYANIKANVKVASTENGIIFSTITYDVRGATSDRNAVYLADIHIDIMDYLSPASCTDQEFRTMWAEFEWENKVAVNTPITSLNTFLNHLVTTTNMRCLTPEKALSGDCGFLAANLYAHSLFGEDALANLSIEKTSPNPEAPVTGHIRIRAKSQGMALSLGDKVNAAQKQAPKQPTNQQPSTAQPESQD